MGAIRESQKPKAINTATLEFSLKDHVVISCEDSNTIELALYKLPFIPGAICKREHPTAIEETILKVSQVNAAISKCQLPNTMPAPFLPLPTIFLPTGVDEGALGQGHGASFWEGRTAGHSPPRRLLLWEPRNGIQVPPVQHPEVTPTPAAWHLLRAGAQLAEATRPPHRDGAAP